MTSTELQVLAKSNKEQIHSCLYNLRGNFLVLGKLLKENRDLGLWKLEYDDWESFLGDPEISMKRAWAYDLIRVYELYVEKLGVPADRLLKIEVTKLLKVAPVVESDPEMWLTKAEVLSVSDLAIERGRAERVKSPLSPPPVSSGLAPMECINGCGPGEKSHFPITRGAGGQEVEEWWVPMCRDCHDEFHRGAESFINKYKKNWARYYYTNMGRE